MDDRSSTACVGLGTGLFPVCLPLRSHGASLCRNEEPRKLHENNHICGSDTRRRRLFVTNIANKCSTLCREMSIRRDQASRRWVQRKGQGPAIVWRLRRPGADQTVLFE